jgi:hypothetical protein
LLTTRSPKTYIKIVIIPYIIMRMSQLKVANSYSWQCPVTVWLQLEQSVSAVHDTKTFTPFTQILTPTHAQIYLHYDELLIMPADDRWDFTLILLTWRIW